MTARHIVAVLGFIALLGWLVGASQPAREATRPHAAKAAAERFAVQDGGKTVLDRISGLHWQQGFSATTMNWANAKTWCSANTPVLPGDGWRLPTVGELSTLADRGKAEPATDVVFAGTPSYNFWSSTPRGIYAFFVYFGTGYATYGATTSGCRVRCVR